MSRSTPAVTRPSALFFLVALSAIPIAHAQEVTKTWQSPAAPGQTLLNEGQAQKAVENNFAPYLAAGPLSWQVTGMRISGETVTYDYRIKPAKLIVTDWIYRFDNQDYSTEQAMVDAIKTTRASSPGCPATQVIPGTWAGVPGAGLGDGADGSNTGESATYDTPNYVINPRTGTCILSQTSVNVGRTRTVKCPNTALMAWKPELGMCGMHPAQEQIGSMLMKYSSSPVANQCAAQNGKGGPLHQKGNPCDATTGNKSQPESDLDLGWIQFVRHFNSMTSAPASGFGPNWTHSHNLFLAMGTDSSGFPPSNVFTVGLIESDGTHVAFSAVGTAYEAANGSGDRLQQQGGNWLLYRSDEVLTFGSNASAAARLRERHHAHLPARCARTAAVDHPFQRPRVAVPLRSTGRR